MLFLLRVTKFQSPAVQAISILAFFAVSSLLPVSAQWFNEKERPSSFSSELDKVDQREKIGPARQRAVNLARATAVNLNGGLSRYMPDACMFSSSATGCLKSADQEGFFFAFYGGPPGWQPLGYRPSKVTELLISPDGRSVVRVISNRDI